MALEGWSSLPADLLSVNSSRLDSIAVISTRPFDLTMKLLPCFMMWSWRSPARVIQQQPSRQTILTPCNSFPRSSSSRLFRSISMSVSFHCPMNKCDGSLKPVCFFGARYSSLQLCPTQIIMFLTVSCNEYGNCACWKWQYLGRKKMDGGQYD